MILIIGLLLLAILAVFTVQNWAPAVPLVVFGSQTAALPIALWVVGAILAGALTVLVMAVMLPLIYAGSSSRRGGTRFADQEQGRRRYVEEPDVAPVVDDVAGADFDDDIDDGEAAPYGRRNPYIDPIGDFRGASRDRPNAPRSKRPDSWESFSQPRRDWSDWGRASSGPAQVDPVLDVDAEPLEAAEDWNDVSYADPVPDYPRRRSPVDGGRYAAYDDAGSRGDERDDRPNEMSDGPGGGVDYEDERGYSAPDYDQRWSSAESYYDEPSPESVGGTYPRDRPSAAKADGFYDDDFVTEEPRYATDYEAEPDYGEPAGPYDDSPEAESTAPGSDYEDYIIDYGSEAEIDQFDAAATRRPARPVSDDASSEDQEDDWNDWEDEPSAPPSAQADSPPVRDIYEVPAAPQSVSRSGSVYSYRYRSDDSETRADEAVSDSGAEPPNPKEESRRPIVPPPPTDDSPMP